MYQKITVNQIGDNTCVKVYDPEKKQLIAVFENYKKAANKLGISAALVQHTCVKKARAYCPLIQLEAALRLSAIKEGDLDRINQCNKKTLLYEKL
jgi:hypothetical protein